MKITILAATLSLGLAPAANAAVTLLDFNELRLASGNTNYVYGPYQHDGYQLAANRCTANGTCFTTTGTALNSLDRVGAALQTQYAGEPFTITRLDGEAFSLLSLDLAYRWGNYSGYGPTTMNVQFTFEFEDGSTLVLTEVLAITAGQRLTVNPLSFDLGPVVSVTLDPTLDLQFDNILLSAPIPEPASWAMMVGGFGAIGLGLRRRRAAPAA